MKIMLTKSNNNNNNNDNDNAENENDDDLDQDDDSICLQWNVVWNCSMNKTDVLCRGKKRSHKENERK